MRNADPSAVPAPVPQRERRGRRGFAWGTLLLPAIAVAGVLGVSWVSGVGDTCGGAVPGCGNVRNAGDVPVTVRALTPTAGAEEVTTTVVSPEERALLRGVVNEVRAEAGQCLLAEGGPFWNARTVIDRTADTTGAWHLVDDWGARLILRDGICPEGDPQ